MESLTWLNTELFEKALKSSRNDETIKVLKFQPDKGFSEHFSSQMFSCEIVFQSMKYPSESSETLKVVVKAYPAEDDVIAPILANSPIFQTEILMYNEVLPLIHDLFQRNGLECDLAPEWVWWTELEI